MTAETGSAETASTTISQTVFDIYYNRLNGIPLPLKHPVTVLQEVPGHHRVTHFVTEYWLERCQKGKLGFDMNNICYGN